MFDRFVSGTRPSWKRRALLIGSLGLHGALAVGLLVFSLFHVAEIAPPALAVVFVPSAQATPGESSAIKRKLKQVAKVTPAAVRPTLPQPTVQPVPVVAEVAPAVPGEDTGGGGGGIGHAGTGAGGPVVDNPGSLSRGIAAPPPRPRNIGPHLLDAQKIAGADPHLPDFVKNARRGLGDSAFTARICVDQSGAVSRIDVLQGIPGADEAIVQSLRGWRYRAQAIPVCFVSRFVFDVQ